MKGSIGAALLLTIALATAACGGGSYGGDGSQTPVSAVVAGTVSSTGLVLDGRVRCTATVSRSVEAGGALGLTYSVRNVSDRPVKFPLVYGFWWVLRSPDGTTYDTRVPQRRQLGGPFIAPATIPPGASRTVPARGGLRVRWRGPLRITPGCDRTALPVLPVGVTSPGPPPDDRTAVADVVGVSGHLLDHCRPEQPGVPVQGQLDSPDGKSPPMSATCSVTLRQEGQFAVAQVLITSPPELSHVRLDQTYEELFVQHAPTYETVAWEFVVTKDGATSVAAAEADGTKAADRMVPDWDWSGAGAGPNPGSGRCGGTGISWGGQTGPTVEFVSVCPA